jgi:hypothetical protein
MTETRNASNPTLDIRVEMYPVANGAFTHVRVVAAGERIYSRNWISHEHIRAIGDFEEQRIKYGAR